MSWVYVNCLCVIPEVLRQQLVEQKQCARLTDVVVKGVALTLDKPECMLSALNVLIYVLKDGKHLKFCFHPSAGLNFFVPGLNVFGCMVGCTFF